MPHSLFLGSALATQDRVSKASPELSPVHSRETSNDARSPLSRRLRDLPLFKSFQEAFRSPPADHRKPSRYSDCENNSLAFIRAHLYHGVFDVAGSLLGIAVIINAMYVSSTGDHFAP